jgi:hypothetical protein
LDVAAEIPGHGGQSVTDHTDQFNEFCCHLKSNYNPPDLLGLSGDHDDPCPVQVHFRNYSFNSVRLRVEFVVEPLNDPYHGLPLSGYFLSLLPSSVKLPREGNFAYEILRP